MMPRLLSTLTLTLACALSACNRTSSETKATMPNTAVDLYALSSKTLEAEPAPLSQYRGQVALVVNVASACGYTPQYAGLQRIYQKYTPQGFVVLGFPSNDFGRQEPGSSEEIREFCVSKYRVDFPMFEKVQTKAGPDQSAIYTALERGAGALPSWNFGKYLVARSGAIVKFFPSDVEPESTQLTAAIEAELAKSLSQ